MHVCVIKNIPLTLKNVSNAYEAVSMITKLYKVEEVQNSVTLYFRQDRLRFKPGYSQIRFVTEFDNIIGVCRT